MRGKERQEKEKDKMKRERGTEREQVGAAGELGGAIEGKFVTTTRKRASKAWEAALQQEE